MSDRDRRSRTGKPPANAFAKAAAHSRTLDARLGALANEAQDMLSQACDLLADAGAPWDSKDYAAVTKLLTEAATKHRRIAELYEAIANLCARATGPS